VRSIRHESARVQLPLAAAGVLSEDELGAVLEHTATCESCRLELEVWGSYAKGLRQLPQPTISAHLLHRIQRRVLQERESSLERRHDALMVGTLVVLSWATSFAAWFAARSLMGVTLEVFGIDLVGPVPWILLSSVLTWVTAGSAAVVLVNRRDTRRSL
jgi:Putative zinc-finger